MKKKWKRSAKLEITTENESKKKTEQGQQRISSIKERSFQRKKSCQGYWQDWTILNEKHHASDNCLVQF